MVKMRVAHSQCPTASAPQPHRGGYRPAIREYLDPQIPETNPANTPRL
jgi:hypothetical protein